MIVLGLASSATAIQNAATVGNASTGAGLLGTSPMVLGLGATYRAVKTAGQVSDGDNGETSLSVGITILDLAGTFSFLRTANTIAGTTGTGLLGSGLMGFDSTNWQKVRTNSAAVLAGTTQPSALLAADPGEWTISNNAGAGNQSTVSKAAGAAGVRHVLRSFFVSVQASVTSAVTTINIRDGATGAGTVLWTFMIETAANQSIPYGLSGLNIVGSAATAMTIEQAAGVANLTAAVNASGYDTV